MNDLISIIVPVYNCENYLQRCVNSILNQSYANLEIILINDGSTDNSGFICDEYSKIDNRIKVIHKRNGGAASARNEGLKIATGSYLGFIDSDDWVANDMYEYLIVLLHTHNADLSSASCILVGESYVETKHEKSLSHKVFKDDKIAENFLYEGAISTPGSFSLCINLFKKELFHDLWFPDGMIGEDIVIEYKIMQRASVQIKSSKVVYFYFQAELSVSNDGLKSNYLDLINAYDQLSIIAKERGIDKHIYLTDVIKARSSFSILAKISYYGISDKSLNRRDIIRTHTKLLRKSYLLLLFSPIALNRKIMVTSLCIHFNFFYYAVRFYKLIKK